MDSMTPFNSWSTMYFLPPGTTMVVSSLSMMAGPVTTLPFLSFAWE